jgi:putative transposase
MANRPPRFPDFTYTGFNRYFLTVCTDQRAPTFRDIEFGLYVATLFLQIGARLAFEVIAYCVMPDHLHLLVHGTTEESALKLYMHRCKQQTGFEWKNRRKHRRRLWQEGFHDRILRDTDPDEGVIRYIIENPVRAGLVDDAREYPLSGSTRYDINELLEAAALWRPPWK